MFLQLLYDDRFDRNGKQGGEYGEEEELEAKNKEEE